MCLTAVQLIQRCLDCTLHKLHHRRAAFGEQAGQDTSKVAGPGADQRPLLFQNGKEI